LTKSRDGYLDALLAIAGANPQLDVAPAPLFLRKRHLKQRVVSIMKEVRMSKTRRVSALAAGLGFLAAACWFVTMALPLAAQPTVVSDAPGVSVDLGGSNILHRTGVSYPVEAIRAHVQGIVTVEASLDSSGNVVDAHVMSGPQELRKAALQAVLQWHFSMDSAQLTRRVSIDFKTPPPPPERPVMGGTTTIGVVGGVPGGVSGGVTSTTREGVLGGVISSTPRVPAQDPLVGRTLGRIIVGGLSDQAERDLLSRLPVKQGDVLSADSFERIQKAVHDYDEHLTVGRMMGRGDNPTANIMIVAPGAERVMTAAASSLSAASVPPPPPGTQRITIGGNVQQAKLVRQPKPEYPALAKQARISGVVHLQVVIAADGTVKDIALLSGHPLLVPPSIEAVKQWQYQPTLLNGDRVEVLTQVDVNFTLSDQ
jgi:TonB family protein